MAFQGERGAYSEEAAVQLLGEEIRLVPRPSFESLFAAIDEGLADYVLAPFENSLAGSIPRSYDLLLEGSLSISREVVIPIRHCLIGCPGTTLEAIRTVESHPVALAQCLRFLSANPQLRRLAAEDTAGSVAQVVLSRDRTRAAIAGRRAAEVYGGVVLLERLEDHSENYTRFLLLTASTETEASEEADKLSLVMKLPRGPGALHHALEPFARRGIDLLKIESRPITGAPWQYYFYLDLRAPIRAREMKSALAELNGRATEVRILGFYPSAQAPGELIKS